MPADAPGGDSMPVHNYVRSRPRHNLDGAPAALLRQWNSRRLDVSAKGENRVPWRGILLRVGRASDLPPGGAESHKILISKDLAMRKCKDLLQMPINAAFNLDQHKKPAILGV